MTTIRTTQMTDTAIQTPATAPAAPAVAHQAKAAVPNAVDTMTFTNAEAFRILMRAAQTGRDLAGKMRTAANKDETTAKMQGVHDQKAQVKGEQTSTIQGMAAKSLAAGAQFGAGAKGTQMRTSTDDHKRSLGAGIDSVAQGGALGGIVTSASDMADKLRGGAYQADQAKIALKLDDVAVSLANQRKDTANASVTQADKMLEGALESFKSSVQRLGDLMSKIAGG